jgi:hypothetical protein
MFSIPAILARSDEVSIVQGKTHDLRRKLRDIIARCLEVDAALQDWYQGFEKAASGPLYWPELSTLHSSLDDDAQGKMLPVSYHFPAFAISQVMCTYWAGMMAVHQQLAQSYGHLVRISESSVVLAETQSAVSPADTCTSTSSATYVHDASDKSSRDEHAATFQNMVRNIMQSTEYFLQSRMGWLGPLVMLTLLQGCHDSLRGAKCGDWSREIAWVNECLERIRGMFSFPVHTIVES